LFVAGRTLPFTISRRIPLSLDRSAATTQIELVSGGARTPVFRYAIDSSVHPTEIWTCDIHVSASAHLETFKLELRCKSGDKEQAPLSFDLWAPMQA
jgi:hypothetical protein